jgi:hypothetical protein
VGVRNIKFVMAFECLSVFVKRTKESSESKFMQLREILQLKVQGLDSNALGVKKM